KSARDGQLRPCVYRTAEGNQRCFRSFGAGVRRLRKARALGSGCLVINFRHCGRDRDDSRASLGEMRCEASMEVSQDVVLCDASVQYMFCDAKDFATLIIDFSSVGATSAPGHKAEKLDLSIRCPPRKRTSSDTTGMSASCQSRPNALQQKAPLFDHLVGAGE